MLQNNLFVIFYTFLKLGLTSFGGPIAHISFFHDEFVKNKKWIDEDSFLDLTGLCQFLPGPASSQIGMAIGFMHGRYWGAVLAWIGFTLPAVVLMYLFAVGVTSLQSVLGDQILHGLKVAAMAVVAQAIYAMIKAFLKSVRTLRLSQKKSVTHFHHIPKKRVGILMLSIFFLLLIGLPILSSFTKSTIINQFDKYYRVGSLVMGGGHVVLPLLKHEVVVSGDITSENFLAGYGLAQAIPGPMFSFVSYLGAVQKHGIDALIGSITCVIAIFLPAMLLILGALPFWNVIRNKKYTHFIMLVIQGFVIGLLISTFINPIWIETILSTKDIIIASAAFIGLTVLNLPSWLIVLSSSSVYFLLGLV